MGVYKIAARHVEGSGKVNITDWGLPEFEAACDALKEVILKAAGEALTYAAAEKVYAYFPYEWAVGEAPSDGQGGPAPDDPTTIYVELPLGPEYEGPNWAFSLRELVEQSIELHDADGKGTISRAAPVVKIGEELRKLAQLIEDAIDPSEADEGFRS